MLLGGALRHAALLLPVHARLGSPLPARQQCLVVHCNSDRRDGDPARRQFNRANSRKGQNFTKKNRRRGRPAWTRSPDDTPLRDGNRDRLMGMLTDRAAKTLLYYLMETNLNVHYWLQAFMSTHPIPKDGPWDDVSGENFLRTLLTMPIQEAKYSVGRAQMYDTVTGIGVDPRNIAQRIMEIRRQVAKEFIVELKDVAEENNTLLRESLTSSLNKLMAITPAADLSGPAAGTPIAEEPAP